MMRAKAVPAEVRRADNLYRLVYEIHRGPTDFYAKFGYPTTSYLAQMIGPNRTRPVSEKVARKVEAVATLPDGWLDRDHATAENAQQNVASNHNVVNEAHVLELMAKLGEVCETEGVSLSTKKLAEAVSFLYAVAQEVGTLSDGTVAKLVRLLK
jgi:hypothetical protein